MAVVVIITVAMVVLWRAGVPQQAAYRVLGAFWELTGAAGLRIAEVTVIGRSRTPEQQILTALGVVSGTPILAIDLAGAKTRLETIPTIRTAVVERRLPNTVHVMIVERGPQPKGKS